MGKMVVWRSFRERQENEKLLFKGDNWVDTRYIHLLDDISECYNNHRNEMGFSVAYR